MPLCEACIIGGGSEAWVAKAGTEEIELVLEREREKKKNKEGDMTFGDTFMILFRPFLIQKVDIG